MRGMWLLLLLACDPKPAPDDTGLDDTAAECGIVVDAIVPTDASSTHLGSQPIEVELSAPDPTATLSLDAPGELVRFEGDERLWFVPDPPLAAGSSHTATLTWCGGEITWTFTTDADVGAPLGGLDLSDHSWALDLGSARWNAPALTGAVDLGMLGIAGFAAGVSHHEGTVADLRLANLDAKGEQDTCSRTPEIPGATVSEGWLRWGPADLSFAAYDGAITLESASLVAGVADDGGRLAGASVHTWVDIASVAALVGVESEAEGCEFFGAFGATCEPCPGSDHQCIELWVDGIEGAARDGGLVEIDTIDASCPE